MSDIDPPRIVVLDGATLTAHVPDQICPPGEPDWSWLQALGDLSVHDRMPAEGAAEALQSADIAVTNKVFISDAIMEATPRLRYIGLLSTGTNSVDLNAAAARGIAVANIPGYSGASVAQHTFALLLELTQRTAAHHTIATDGTWAHQSDFCISVGSIPELEGRTFGIIGMGDIGRRCARIADAFGMKVMAASRSAPDIGLPVSYVDRNTLFAEADVVCLCLPWTPETTGMIDAERLKQMKPDAYLINCARGALVNEQALADALHAGEIAGAGLDVLFREPPPADHPLLDAPNCIITPHIAWATQAARCRCLRICVDNMQAFLSGQPQNLV